MLLASRGFPHMASARDWKRRARGVIAPVAFLAVAGYFAWSATQGDHGLVAASQREGLLRQAKADLAVATADRDGWERRVAALRASHLDPDMLDERARAMLNLADPTDVIVPYASKDKLF